MSKKKAKIIIGNFYLAYGGGRHPAYIYEKNGYYKTYLSIKFGTTRRKNMLPIESIDGKNVSYVQNRPFEGARRDYGDHMLIGLKINPKDYVVIEAIKLKKPKLSKRASLKHKKMPSSG